MARDELFRKAHPEPPQGLFIAEAGQTYHQGTTSPLIGIPMLDREGRISVPPGAVPIPNDYFALFLTIREYGPDLTGLGSQEDEAIELFGRQLIAGLGGRP